MNEEITKEERIKQEETKLMNLFKDIPEETLNKVISLIGNAAFMIVTLEDLQAVINVKGCTETYTNGASQSGVKKTSEVEVYNTMIKNHMSIIKQLTDLMPYAKPEPTEQSKFLAIQGRVKSG